jgi:hypothetical protein
LAKRTTTSRTPNAEVARWLLINAHTEPEERRHIEAAVHPLHPRLGYNPRNPPSIPVDGVEEALKKNLIPKWACLHQSDKVTVLYGKVTRSRLIS